ncbi:hypothetical protein CYMTET_32017 [Cymbomonas tetramitiformis]|uniref:Uncharacterized protein n=1 Tax=Cymbomonas tetramitiformis TaxID=36881 RepID=A0AAE0KSC9_9CHLO|nr:hypothetical protein CYMTET_37005 [Cymbomonas tetramitiformis]KAK3258963.1 hypothetical protein CYMTET_32017 [Cymbomonas tetramitiformis]
MSSLADDIEADEPTTRWPAPPRANPRESQGGNWPQPHGRRHDDNKHFGIHSVSFHVVSKAFVPACVRCPPGSWHDSANCPTADIECDTCVIEQADDADGFVSAFQAAFDSEDDASFAQLCARHDHPLVRRDEEPSEFAENVEVGLGAQYILSGGVSTFYHPPRSVDRWISSTHDSAGVADSDSESIFDYGFVSGDEDVIVDDVPPPAQSTGWWCQETGDWGVPHGSRAANSLRMYEYVLHAHRDGLGTFNLDSGVLCSDTTEITGLADSIENYNDNREFLSVDHSRGG